MAGCSAEPRVSFAEGRLRVSGTDYDTTVAATVDDAQRVTLSRLADGTVVLDGSSCRWPPGTAGSSAAVARPRSGRLTVVLGHRSVARLPVLAAASGRRDYGESLPVLPNAAAATPSSPSSCSSSDGSSATR